MESANDEQQEREWEYCKASIRELARTDGTLVSPIDLVLETTTPVSLDRLRWLNFDKEPTKLKLTNTGETAIVSGKWEQIRPYLNSGPLDANYVFSQLHFHWGQDEHEGSEHMAGGISYPLEMHVIFYKTGYLTQPAALKHDDGIVTVVYLVKLQHRSTPALQMLTEHLDKVTEPHTSTQLPPVPLSCLLVPFTKDYFLYWGSLSTTRCSHKVLWFVSRAALGISIEDLDKFRSLLDSKRERLSKNFRTTNEAQGRTVLHVNPSADKKHVLHPGTVEPPGNPVITIVNCAQVPTLDPTKADEIFSKGDCVEEQSKKTSEKSYNSKTMYERAKSFNFSEGLNRRCSIQFNLTNSKNTSRRRSPSVNSSSIKSSDSNSSRYSPNLARDEEIRRLKCQKKTEIATRKVFETERKLRLQKLKLQMIKRREESLSNESTTTKKVNGNNNSDVCAKKYQPCTIKNVDIKTTIPRPIAKIPMRKPYSKPKPKTEQKPILETSSKMPCELCYC